ncbi:MAG: peroxiredoxin [Deltaproteobacteria bacterium]|nr:peroxiredoxin [Deltaproteobacteria bacterium]
MSLVQKQAPAFKATAVMPNNEFQDVSLEQYRGKYVVLFFYPLDFTFVCPTEILAFDKHVKDFEKRGAVVLGCSVDSKHTHYAWRNTTKDKGGIGGISYPLIADLNKNIARDYGVLVDGGDVALRGTFIIDKKGVVRTAHVNDLPIGRSVTETLRTLDAVKFVDEHGDQVCPAEWHEGEKTMNPTATGVASYLSSQK